ncbi:MAG: hypothetical protein ACT4PL_11380, partial [Phycisphaerales bacterium]
ARKAAEGQAAAGARVEPPAEVEYRYAGPRPRTREAAILMICDAAESATRTLPDPSPTRIESLVRAIAHKRLMDGQFDHCELTLRDVAAVVDAVARALSAIHHQRVASPETAPIPMRSTGPLTQTGLANPPTTASALPAPASGPATGPATGPGVALPAPVVVPAERRA